MTLDECIVWHGGRDERYAHASRLGKQGALLTVAFACGVILHRVMALPVWGLYPLAVAGLCGMVLMVISHTRLMRCWILDERFHDSISRMHPPHELVMAAGGLDEYPMSILWAQECFEAHMPGDCPLCGAE